MNNQKSIKILFTASSSEQVLLHQNDNQLDSWSSSSATSEQTCLQQNVFKRILFRISSMSFKNVVQLMDLNATKVMAQERSYFISYSNIPFTW